MAFQSGVSKVLSTSRSLNMCLLLVVVVGICLVNTVQSFSVTTIVPKNKKAALIINHHHHRQVAFGTTKPKQLLLRSDSSTAMTRLHAVRIGGNETMSSYSSSVVEADRFDRAAATAAHVDLPCILTMYGKQYNMTAWAKAHPGGVKVLQKFHNKDATKAFEAADHSAHAYDMLKDFEIVTSSSSSDTERGVDDNSDVTTTTSSSSSACPVAPVLALNQENQKKNQTPRWRKKLFTREDPIGIHKYAGIFVLLHYLYRYVQMYFFDKTAGFGTQMVMTASGELATKMPSMIGPLCLIPHCLLSLSSFIFHTVPQERVVGKPMIWKEYRVHNAGFALRSALSSYLAWLSIVKGHAAPWRRLAVVGSCVGVLVAQIVADVATERLRSNTIESTTATMPYWEGCSLETQKKFKHFYAYCQFMATLGCICVANPIWGLAVMLPIQLASLLMTLVRKGLLSARGYHIGYTISLAMPFVTGLRTCNGVLGFLPYAALGGILYHLRRQGVNKYALWVPVLLGRILYGDAVIHYQKW